MLDVHSLQDSQSSCRVWLDRATEDDSSSVGFFIGGWYTRAGLEKIMAHFGADSAVRRLRPPVGVCHESSMYSADFRLFSIQSNLIPL